MTAILAIETATDACSAALMVEGKITSRFIVAPQQHASLILPMCDELLHEAKILPAQLSAVAFGRGPGSFTGVRIATAVAQGISYAHQLPVIPVSSLQALAHAAFLKHRAEKILSGIDARMQEIYWGMFELQDGFMQPVSEEIVAKSEDLPVPDNNQWFAAGSAWSSYEKQLQQKYSAILKGNDETLFPTAEAVLLLAINAFNQGKTVSAENAVPVYLRDNVVKKPTAP